MTPRRCTAVVLAALVALTGSTAAQNAYGKDSSPGVQEVIAEGLGKTADEALKDAFRNAVREVVGAVVDQQTRLKNDEVIDDKVLTASSGFVSGYERVGRPKEEGGLVRVKVKARVERAELVDRLRELKITVREVDPGRVVPKDEDRRFSDDRVKAMTKEEMVANKTEILQDALTDLPKVLEARAKAPDRFDFDAASSTLTVEVQMQPDQQRYVQFLKRLQMRLDKIALKKLVAVADGTARDVGGWGYQDTDNGNLRGFQASCPALSSTDLRGAPDAWILWVLTDVLKNGAVTRWAGYVLDTDPRKTLVGLHGELQVRVTLRDADGKAVTEETFEPREHQHRSASYWLGSVTHRPKSGDTWWTGGLSVLTPLPEKYKVTQESTINVVLAPLPVKPWWGNQTGNKSIEYVLARPYPRKIRLSKEEMQRVKDIRCAVLFRPEK